MSARVNTAAPPLIAADVVSGRAVRGPTWTNAAALCNWLSGRGGVLIPPYTLGTIASGVTKTLNFNLYPRYQALHRAWVVRVRRDTGLSPAAVTVTRGAYSRVALISGSRRDAGSTILILEELSSRAATETQTSIDIDCSSLGTAAYVSSVACYEVPRVVLEKADSMNLENAVDVETCRSLQPICDIDQESIHGVAVGTALARTICRRNGIYMWAVDTADAYTTTQTSNQQMFLLGIDALERMMFAGDTTGTLSWRVYAKATTSAGVVDVDTVSGGAAADSITVSGTGSWGWWPAGGSSTFTIDCEDLAESDGRRSTRDDEMTFQARAGASGQIEIASICVGVA